MKRGANAMPYNKHITGQIIGKIRVDRGLTQEQLSGLANISRSYLAEVETGKKSASVETLWKISEALAIPLTSLFRLIESAHRTQNP